MSDTTSPAGSTATAVPATPTTTALPASPTSASPIPDGSVGTAQVRIVTGTKRVQVLAGGAWYDLEGVAAADVYTSDPRYAARITMAKISTISQVAAGAAPAGIDGSHTRQIGASSTSPNITVGAPAAGQVTLHPTTPAAAAAAIASQATAATPATVAPAPSSTSTAATPVAAGTQPEAAP